MSRLWVTPEEMGDAGSSVYAYEASKTASFILWALSGRKYAGTATTTETYQCPCRRTLSIRHSAEPALFAVEPYLRDGGVYNSAANDVACSCSGVVNGVHTRIRLRGRPVRSISKVMSGGQVVDPDKYQLVNSSQLQGAPGASLDMCGITVTYTYGTEPPTAGRRAARYLATELVKSYSGEHCELPERVTSVSRQGVSLTILDNQTFLDDQRTGIYAVDLFLKTVNPDKARKKPRVFSPDLPRYQRVSGTSSQAAGPLDLIVTPGEEFVWRLPLTGSYGSLLLDEDWEPQGQISTWSGAVVFDAEPGRFDVVDNELILRLTASETSRINLGGSGSWDLYALNVHENSTVVHILSSNVILGKSTAASIL